MWFRNLLVYRLSTPLTFDQESLEASLSEKKARPCASQELSTFGFTAPIGEGDAPLVHAAGGNLIISAQSEAKILPSSVINDEVKERVSKIEEREDRKVYKKERDSIKDEVVLDFLPRAFIKKTQISASIDLKNGLIYVNTASHKKAEELLSTIRELVGSLPVRPINVKQSVDGSLTSWVKGDVVPESFSVLDNAVMKDSFEEGGKVSITRQDLASDEFRLHLETGKRVTQLAMAWEDKLSFTIDDKLVIKGIKYGDLLLDQADDDAGEDAGAVFDASFIIMMSTFGEFIPALLEALGGEEVPESI